MTRLCAENIVLRIGSATILNDVTLALPSKGSVAMVGPNGAAKSSLLRVLAGVAKPDSGEATLDGVPFVGIPSAVRVRTIGYMPQHFAPYWDLTVDELMRLGIERRKPASASDIAKALEKFEIIPFRARRWSTLSGGERARVLLAMTLSIEPPILLADEPGASLDIQHRIAFARLLQLRAESCLSVVVLHDLDLALHFFDRIIVMSGGRIMADGDRDFICESDAVDRAFGVDFRRISVDGETLLRPPW